jgi:hypothetical protein
MPNRLSLSVSLVLFLVSQAAALSAQNLLTNPDFDTGLSGFEVGDGVSWDGARDADGSPASGSARILTDFSRVGLTPIVVTQCIPMIEPGTRYVLGGKAFLPSGQTGSGDVEFSVGFFPDPFCQGTPIPGGGVGLTPGITTRDRWTAAVTTVTAAGHSAGFAAFLRASSVGSFTASVDDLLFQPVSATPFCLGDASTLCLGALRFKVTATYDAGNGNAGDAHGVPLTADTGYFWFFAASNVEVVVKVIDGCGLGGHYWVFAGGLTNVKTVITVTDLQTGAVKTYTNPPGQAFAPIEDTAAFACP